MTQALWVLCLLLLAAGYIADPSGPVLAAGLAALALPVLSWLAVLLCRRKLRAELSCPAETAQIDRHSEQGIEGQKPGKGIGIRQGKTDENEIGPYRQDNGLVLPETAHGESLLSKGESYRGKNSPAEAVTSGGLFGNQGQITRL